jgi:predicted PurR-regulated permease PerM
MNSATRLQQLFFFSLLLVAIVLVFIVIKSFLAPLVLAFTLSIVFRPFYKWLQVKYRGRESLAAATTVVAIVCVVLIPMAFIVQVLVKEAFSLYTWFNTAGGGGLLFTNIKDTLAYYFPNFAPQISLDATLYIRQGLQWIVQHFGSFFTEFFHLALAVVIMIIALFYILRDGHIFRDHYMKLSPLNDKYDQQIFNTMAASLESVLKGAIIVAVLQGFMGGIGSLIGGYSSPVIFGLAAGTLSFLPGIGPGAIMIPAIIFKLVTGHIVHGVLFLIWYLIGLTVIDNIISPHLLQRGGIQVHQFFILLGVLGGIFVFGPIGFIVGPLIMAFFFALIEIYPAIIERL